MLHVCSCGFACDDPEWFSGHLFEHPGHQERDSSRYRCEAISASRPWVPRCAGQAGVSDLRRFSG